MTFSFLVLLAVFAVTKPDLLKIELRDLYKFVSLGVLGMAGSNFFYYYAIKEMNVGTAILLQYMAPIFVLAYTTSMKEETLTATKVIAATASIVGCFLAVGGFSGKTAALTTAGLFAGIGAAFSWSFTNVSLKHLLKKYRVWTATVYAFGSASVFWLVINPPWKIIAAGYPASTWLTLCGFAVMSVLIPHTLYFNGVRHLTASRAIITATIEPVFAILFAFILLGEAMSGLQILGGVIVIGAILTLQLQNEV
jgi:drug/metabolite transporter (DMT)-like permease